MTRLDRIAAVSALVAGAALAACGGGPLFDARSARYCEASNAAIDDYVQRISALVSNKARPSDVLRRREQVLVSFALAADGSASDFRVERTPRPEAGAEISRAAVAAAPFPRPAFDPGVCFHGSRATIGIISYAGCDDARADEYTSRISHQIQSAVNAAGLMAPAERAQVALRIKLIREGAAAITVHDAPSEESGTQVAAIAQKLAPFETPADSIRECVADQSFFVWITLPGLSRPPIRSPD